MYTAQPAKATILIAREMPPFGGDTMFTNQYLAYETLSDGMKEMVGKLKGVNDGNSRKNFRGKTRAELAKSGASHNAAERAGSGCPNRLRPPARPHAPGNGPQSALYRLAHGADRRNDRRRKPADTSDADGAFDAARVHLPRALGKSAHSPCGTTAVASTTRSTTIRANGAAYTKLPSKETRPSDGPQT